MRPEFMDNPAFSEQPPCRAHALIKQEAETKEAGRCRPHDPDRGGASVAGDAAELDVVDARLPRGVHDVDQRPRGGFLVRGR